MGSHNISADGSDYLILPTFLLFCFCLVVIVAAGFPNSQSPPQSIGRAYRKVKKVNHNCTDPDPLQLTTNGQVASHYHYASTGMKRLPVEVVEQIIDHLWDDKAALIACKLTQRAWVPRARLHLHHTLTLKMGGHDPYKLRFFLPVAYCVRRLYVAQGLLKEVASSLLVEIDELEELYIHGDGPAIHASEFPPFSKLKALRLYSHCFRSAPELFTVLARLPHLDNLAVELYHRLGQGGIIGHTLQEAVSNCAPPKLETLRVTFHMDNNNNNLGPLPQMMLGVGGANVKHLVLDLRCYLPGPIRETCA